MARKQTLHVSGQTDSLGICGKEGTYFIDFYKLPKVKVSYGFKICKFCLAKCLEIVMFKIKAK